MIQATISTSETTLRDRLKSKVRDCRAFPAMVHVPAEVDPTVWLNAQGRTVKLLWSNRDDSRLLAGCGHAAKIVGRENESVDSIFDRCRERIGRSSDLKFYGGFAFQTDGWNPSQSWGPFGRAQFWLPRLACDGSTISCVVMDQRDVSNALMAIDQMVCDEAGRISEPHDELPTYHSRKDAPDRDDWGANIEEALRLFNAEVLEKIVLARQATFTFDRALTPISLASRLIHSTRSCYHFCFQVAPNTAFLGATPERLFKRDGCDLLSEVVAGTRRRSDDPEVDERLAQELLASKKDQLEHDIVRKSIRQRLHKYVTRLAVDSKASILKLNKKQHLYSGVRATLKSDISDGKILHHLHPTPAVGGYPVENALTEITRLEPFDRGWYAAPVGWIGADSAEFAVAIRSGLVNGNRLSLFSGAGIVPGSTAEQEWQEIEYKIADFLDVISS